MNVDPVELAKFSDIAHKWWDPNSEFRPLHEMNPLRLQWVQSQVSLAGAKVLDVGCGGGIFSEALASAADHVLGIDLAARSLSVARLHALETGLSNVDYEEVPVEELASRQPAAFDVVTCMEMLEHVPLPEKVIQACAALAKPGGWVFFSTLNRNSRAFFQAIVGAEYLLGLLAKGTHEYARFIRPSELARWTRQSDLQLQKLEGVGYNPLTRRFKLQQDCGVNYLLSCRRHP